MQFDLFNDSREVALRNDVIHALEQADTAAARQAWDILALHFPQDQCLAGLNVLIVEMGQRRSEPFTGHSAVEQACKYFLHDAVPAARCHLGTHAQTWISHGWQAMAARAQALPYHPDHRDTHAASLWVRAGQWQAAADATECIPSWRRIPGPLSWMLQARLALQGLPANWGLLAELAWLAPDRLEHAVQSCSDPLLRQLLDKFECDFAEEPEITVHRWFPAWLLTERADLAARLAQAQPGQYTAPEKAMRLMVETLGLERQGRKNEWVSHRKVLQQLHPLLFRCFMRTR